MTGTKHGRGRRLSHGEAARRAAPAAARFRRASAAAIFLVATVSTGAFAGEITTWSAAGQMAPGGIIRSPGSVWIGGTGSLSDTVLAMFVGDRSGACAGLPCPPLEPAASDDAAPLLDALVPDTDFGSPFNLGPDPQ